MGCLALNGLLRLHGCLSYAIDLLYSGYTWTVAGIPGHVVLNPSD